jgi:hypothetical protein
MVSIGPYNQSYDYRYMYDLPDLQDPKIKGLTKYQTIINNAITNNTVLGLLQKNKDFSKFSKIVDKSGMADKLADPQFNGTLFVPSDAYLSSIPSCEIDSIDQSHARHMVNFSTLNGIIDEKLLRASPASYLYSRDLPLPKILVENLNGKTILNGSSVIIKYDIQLDNGMIHIVDNLIQPTYCM